MKFSTCIIKIIRDNFLGCMITQTTSNFDKTFINIFKFMKMIFGDFLDNQFSGKIWNNNMQLTKTVSYFWTVKKCVV